MSHTEDAIYTIKTTSRLVDLNAHTIRAWERRYKALSPGRHINGRRLYSDQDVKRLQLLSKLVSFGHSISTVAGLSTEALESLVTTKTQEVSESAIRSTERSVDGAASGSDELSMDRRRELNAQAELDAERRTAKSVGPGVTETLGFAKPILESTVAAVKRFDLIAVHQELENARFILSPREYILSLAFPLLRRIGELVYNSDLSIAQEHGLSAILRSSMMQVLYSLRHSVAAKARVRQDLWHGKTFALTTTVGDLHEFGILGASIIIAANGHNPHYFGSSMPAKALADAANAIRADYVILGVSLFRDETRPRDENQYQKELEDNLRGAAKIWWGGDARVSADYLASGRTKVFNSIEAMEAAVKELSADV